MSIRRKKEINFLFYFLRQSIVRSIKQQTNTEKFVLLAIFFPVHRQPVALTLQLPVRQDGSVFRGSNQNQFMKPINQLGMEEQKVK